MNFHDKPPAHQRTIEPSILYFGTPVALIGTTNEDDTFNLAPMSSAWWLGWRCMLGFGRGSKTPENMVRTRECVINLPSACMSTTRSCSPTTTTGSTRTNGGR